MTIAKQEVGVIIYYLPVFALLGTLVCMHTIPTFPDKVPLDISHASLLKEYLADHRHGISEFSLASLLPFTKKRDYMISSYIDVKGSLAYCIVGKQLDSDQHIELFAMLPSGYPGREITKQLFSQVKEINAIAPQLKEQWEKELTEYHSELLLTEDRNNADYIYLKKQLIELKGAVLHKKMQHVLHFKEDYPNRILIPSHLVKDSDMVEVLNQWVESKKGTAIEDYESTLCAITHRKELGLHGAVLYVGDKPIAFTLGEEERGYRFIIHYEKAISSYRGVYQYLNRTFLFDLPETIQEINREQDLGIPGLRQAKMSYEPAELLMKYKVRKRES